MRTDCLTGVTQIVTEARARIRRFAYGRLALLLAIPILANAQAPDSLAQVRELRLLGALDSALTLAHRQLTAADGDSRRIVFLRLELARIHDRFGLHFNRRPVSAAMAQVDTAARVRGVPPRLGAHIALARAELHYRAEPASSGFPAASREAMSARDIFRREGDHHGAADATHLLGLIRLQVGDLTAARMLFEESLALDQSGGVRTFFLGEYERHVALVDLASGDTTAALPRLERSLEHRRRAGARDASLYAAISLGSVLLALGNTDAARVPIAYADSVAATFDAPSGRAQLALLMATMYQRIGDTDAVRNALSAAIRIADSINARGVAAEARRRLAALP